MAVYVERLTRLKRTRYPQEFGVLWADSEAELARFAAEIGLAAIWREGDVFRLDVHMRKKAIGHGAIKSKRCG